MKVFNLWPMKFHFKMFVLFNIFPDMENTFSSEVAKKKNLDEKIINCTDKKQNKPNIMK